MEAIMDEETFKMDSFYHQEEIDDAVQKERTRCFNIVQAVRNGDIDGDLRDIASLIDSSWTVEELLEDD